MCWAPEAFQRVYLPFIWCCLWAWAAVAVIWSYVVVVTTSATADVLCDRGTCKAHGLPEFVQV